MKGQHFVSAFCHYIHNASERGSVREASKSSTQVRAILYEESANKGMLLTCT